MSRNLYDSNMKMMFWVVEKKCFGLKIYMRD